MVKGLPQVQLCWTTSVKSDSDLSPGSKLMVLITSCLFSSADDVGQRLCIYSEAWDNKGCICRYGELKEAMVWSHSPLRAEMKLFFQKHNILHFPWSIFFSFQVLGKEPGFGFGGVWLPPDNLWCPPARGRSHFRKVRENNSHDPFCGWKRSDFFYILIIKTFSSGSWSCWSVWRLHKWTMGK